MSALAAVLTLWAMAYGLGQLAALWALAGLAAGLLAVRGRA